MLKKSAVLIALFLFIMPVFVFAQQESESDILYEDVLRFAPEIRIVEPIGRDLIAAGGNIEINKPVAQDLIALGGTIIINAPIDGDVRVFGGNVVLNNIVSGNVAIFSGNTNLSADSEIGGSVFLFSGKANLDGLIGGHLKSRTGELYLSGKVLGDADITIPESESFSLGHSGAIGGNLNYKSGEIVSDKIQEKVGGEVNFSKLEQSKKFDHFWFFLKIVSLFGMLVLGLVLVSLFPRALRQVVTQTIKSPANDWLWGFVILVAAPILVVLLVLTIIGFPLALVLAGLYVIALYLAKIMVGIIVGTYIVGAIKGKDKIVNTSLVLIMVVGIVAFWLIASIPVLGKIISLLAVVWGLGVIARLEKLAFNRLEK